MKHIISLKEQSKEDILEILDMAEKLKEKRKKGDHTDYLKNKTMVMLFQKTSTRTRLSFEAAMTELGGHSIYLDQRTTQISMSDFKDEIRAIMRYCHVLMFRALKAEDVKIAASFNQVPVIDACSEKYHPAQALGDFLTMIEHSKGLENIKKVVWVGVENNVMNTLMLMCCKLGIKFVIVSPEVNEASVDKELNDYCEKTGLVARTLDMKEALKDADYVHTDTYMDMEFFKDGKIREEFKEKYEARKQKFRNFQINGVLLDAHDVKLMHCMPCHIGYEITRDAVDHENSVIFDQAENRMHIQKAMILWCLEKKV